MRNFIALIVFIILQILFIPLAILGGVWTGYKQIIVSRNLGVSQTAIEILNGRWTMHIFGMRDDVAVGKLAPVIPNTSTWGLWLALFPLYVYSRISGQYRWYPTIAEQGEEGLANLVMNRTGYFDDIIDKSKAQAEQFVMMGAGLDTRAYSDLKQSGLKMFELDQAATQRLKLKALAKTDIDTSHVTFVETDFSLEEWFQTLHAAGYDPEKRTIFLWEGVTLYLGEGSVRHTLRTMKENAAAGSVIVADIYSKGFVTGEQFPSFKVSMPTLDLTGERLAFGLEMGSDRQKVLEAFVESEGLTVGDTYFMGEKTEKGAWGVVAELKI